VAARLLAADNVGGPGSTIVFHGSQTRVMGAAL